MNIIELYENMQESPEVVVARFGGNAQLLERFVRRFPEEPTYQFLKDSVETENYEELERAAHTLKGVAMNLGFAALGEASSELMMAIRHSELDTCAERFEKIHQRYVKIIGLISELD